MKNTVDILKQKGYKQWVKKWYLDTNTATCELVPNGKNKAEKIKHAETICEELNGLFEALIDGRVKIEPKRQ